MYGGSSGSGGGALGVLLVVYVIAYLVAVLPLWFVFKKAGKTPWHALVPIYNIVVILEIVGRPIWWLILFFIPCVSLVVGIIVAIDLAKAFGHGAGFAIGLILLTWIFLLILAFNDDRYLGPVAGPSTTYQPPPPPAAA